MTFNKQEYDNNRKAGKRGQGELPKPKATKSEVSEAEVSFDNDGRMIVKNRAYRRSKAKLPGSNIFTTKQKTKTERQKFRKLGRH